jgi:uncharacterized protein YdhG (YjbR/CyaY superfamily)
MEADMATKPTSIDDYLAGLDEPRRAALQRLRETIQAAAPDATECISYLMPTFRQDGMLVSFAAWKGHYALYPLSVATTRALAADLEGYSTAKGTIRFPLDQPLPEALVTKLVKARLAENARRKSPPSGGSTRRSRGKGADGRGL